MSTELLEAMRAADRGVPAELEVFDRVAATGEPRPDFFELSVRAGGAFVPNRLTYYFDVHRRGAAVAREAGARFVRLAAELGVTLPAALLSFVSSDAPGEGPVLQVVLGIEAPSAGQSVRAKYYLVFRDNPGRRVRELLASLELEPTGGSDPDKVYILGCDATPAGLEDVKLYFRLQGAVVPKLVENVGEVADLLRGSRDVVFQQCTRRPARRQLYLHVSDTAVLTEWLARRGLDAALGRARRINERLRGLRVDPWIVSWPYEGRRVTVESPTLYLHLAREA